MYVFTSQKKHAGSPGCDASPSQGLFSALCSPVLYSFIMKTCGETVRTKDLV